MAETNIRGVFGLSDYRKRQVSGLIPERIRETYREYGYFGGGYFNPGGPFSTVDRIDYSNDTQTASVRGPLSFRRHVLGATGNSNFGYFGGGLNLSIPATYSTVDRIDYTNDTATASVRGPLSLEKSRSQATGNSNFGYFGGGFGNSSTISTVDRIDYSNDSATASVRGPLSTSGGGRAGSGNSNFGYYAGGRLTPSEGAGRRSTIDRINYSNDTSTALSRSPLTEEKDGVGASGNSNFAYFAGGTPIPYKSTIERLDYSNDLITPTIRGPLSAVKSYGASTGNSNFGYYGKGTSVAVLPGAFSTIERIDYSNDTQVTSIRGAGVFSSYNIAATSSASFGGSPNSSYASNFTFPTVPNAGYFGGGFDGTNALASIDKIDYANDTATASVRSALSVGKSGPGSTGNSNFGYFSGGGLGEVSIPSTSPTTTSTDRLEYSSDTQNTVIRGPLSIQRAYIGGVGNSNFGYFAGGRVSGASTRYSTIDRIDYSTDTSTTSRSPLTEEKDGVGASGNSNFGYFYGGTITPYRSTIERLDYSNDLTIPNIRNPLSASKSYGAATGNSNFGYFGGGTSPGSPFSTVERIDYSNDIRTTIRGSLSLARYRLRATGNSNFGYFGGGGITSVSIYYSTIDRINFSNDTAIASIRGPLPVTKSASAATSPLAYGGAPIYFTNPLPEVFQKQIVFNDANTLELPFKRVLGSYGYFGGGFDETNNFSTVDRVDYSNDTSTASVRGPLSLAKRNPMASGNSNFGYFGGGFGNSSTISTVNRIDYSNDIATASVRGPISLARQGLSATGNSNFGYFGGGEPTTSRVDRIDYSNDTATASVRGPLSSTRDRLASSGNSNFGYFGGGLPGSISRVDRIDYSNDSITASVRGPLSLARNRLVSTTNARF